MDTDSHGWIRKDHRMTRYRNEIQYSSETTGAIHLNRSKSVLIRVHPWFKFRLNPVVDPYLIALPERQKPGFRGGAHGTSANHAFRIMVWVSVPASWPRRFPERPRSSNTLFPSWHTPAPPKTGPESSILPPESPAPKDSPQTPSSPLKHRQPYPQSKPTAAPGQARKSPPAAAPMNRPVASLYERRSE